MKKIISLILALAMILSLVPAVHASVELPDSVSIVGSNLPGIAEWDPADSAGVMTPWEDLLWRIVLPLTAGSTISFKFAGDGQWGSTCNLGSATVVLGQEVEMLNGSSSTNITLTPESSGDYAFYVDLSPMATGTGNPTLLVEQITYIGETEPEDPTEVPDTTEPSSGPSSMAIVGTGLPGISEWDPADANGDMTEVSEHVYEITLTFVSPTNTQFKFAGNNQWDGTYDFGCTGSTVPPGIWYSLIQYGSNLSISNALGTYTFTLDLTAFEAGTGSAQLYIEHASPLPENACGMDLTWELATDGTLTISGTGEMFDFAHYGSPWNEIRSRIRRVVLADGVTSIGDYAFYDCVNLVEVNLPDSLQRIGSWAFNFCCLGSITLPAGVIQLDEMALQNAGLTEIVFLGDAPQFGENACRWNTAQALYYGSNTTWTTENRLDYGGTLLWIPMEDDGSYTVTGTCGDGLSWSFSHSGTLTVSGTGAMEDYADSSSTPWAQFRDAITEVVLEEGITHVGAYAFYELGLTGITLPEGLESVGTWAFSYNSFTVLDLPDGIITLGDYAFSGNQITALDIPSSVTTLGTGVFLYNSLTSITVPGSIAVIGSEAFSLNHLSSVVIEEGVVEIGSGAFHQGYHLQEVSLPSTLTTIGNSAFFAGGFTEITLPEGLLSIGDGAFEACRNLTQVTIPASVESLGDCVFNKCYNLTRIDVDPDSAHYISDEAGVLFNKDQTLLVWASPLLTQYSLPDTVVEIGGAAFDSCSTLTSLTLNEKLVTIGEDAFCNCSGLTALDLPDGLQTIGNFAFCDCSGLTSLNLPDGLQTIGNYAFSYCSGLTSLNLPDNVVSIGYHVFAGCDNLTEVTLPKNMTTIPYGMFNGCTVPVITIPEGYTAIEEYGFSHFEGSAIILPESLTTIGRGAFFNCNALSELYIPAGVTEIGEYAFDSCDNLERVTFGGSAPTIGDYAFDNVDAVAFYPAGDATWTSEVRQSYGGSLTWMAGTPDTCFPLTGSCGAEGDNVTFSISLDGVLTITGTGAMADFGDARWFGQEYHIEKVVIGEGVTTVGSNAFSNFANLTCVEFPDSLTAISQSAFQNCVKLTAVEFPASLTSIGACAFRNCDGLTHVSIPAGVEAIGDGAFTECDSLTGVTIDENSLHYRTDEFGVLYTKDGSLLTYCPHGLTGSYTVAPGTLTIGGCAFYESSLEQIILPEGLTTIGSYGFYDADISAITLPSTLKRIGSSAFYSCLREITLPEGLTTIEDRAFHSSGIQSIIIPASVTYMGSYVFGTEGNVSSLQTITFLGSAPAFESQVLGDVEGTAYYPLGHPSWTPFVMASFDGDMTWIGQGEGYVASGYCGTDVYWMLEENGKLIIGGSGTMKNFSAGTAPWYAHRDSITQAVIRSGVTNLGSYAFADCAALTAVSLPEGLTAIGANAFDGCSALTEISLPLSLTNVEANAFNGCTGLTLVQIADLSAWAAITFGSAEANPLYYAGVLMCNGENVTSANLTGNVGDHAFCGCTTLTEVTFGSGLTEIGTDAFAGCTGLTSLRFCGNAPTIGTSAFGGVTATAYYPEWNGTWASALLNYGGTLTWVGTPPAVVVSGTCGDSLTWELDEAGLLTVSGTGDMTSFSYGAAPWYAYKDDILTVKLTEGVTSVGSFAFHDLNCLTTAAIANSVTKIGYHAFYNCQALTGLSLPESLTELGDDAFSFCGDLGHVTVPSGITTLGTAFRHSGISAITLPDTLTTISEQAFYYCENLTEITIPASVTLIDGIYVFAGCDSLTAIHVEQGSTVYRSIDGVLYSYDGTTLISAPGSITAHVIPEGTTTIGSHAFYGCDQLTDLSIPEGVTTIKGAAFSYCAALTGVKLPDSLTTLGVQSFSHCTGLKSLTIPQGITVVPDTLCGWCTSLTTVVLPDGITAIEDSAFYSCEALTDLTIGSGLTCIGKEAFDNCGSLTMLHFTGDAPVLTEASLSFPTWVQTACYGTDNTTWTEEVRATLGNYTWVGTAEGTCGDSVNWKLNCEGTLTVYGTGAMADYWTGEAPWYKLNDQITAVIVEEGVTHIGRCAFQGIPNSIRLSLPDSLRSIGGYSFLDSSVQELVLPEGLTSIGTQAFSNLRYFGQVHLPSTLTTLGDYAFSYSYISGFTVAEGNTVFSADANGVLYAWDMTGLVIVPSAYEGVLTIPDTVTNLWNGSFDYTPYITEIIIPASLTDLADNRFLNSIQLTAFRVDAGNTAYSSDDNGILYNKDKTLLLKAPRNLSGDLQIPEGVTTIENCAFYNCDSLTTVTFPVSVTTLGTQCFSWCTNLVTIRFLGEAPELDPYGSYFEYVNATVYYPADTASWTNDIMLNYGGTLMWTCDGDVCFHEEGHDTDGNCLSCGSYLGHSYDDGVIITDPTCLSSGLKTFTCTICGSSCTSEVPATGHSFDSITATTEPTCTTQGTETWLCSVCGTEKTEYTGYADHRYENGVCLNCGTAEPVGLTIYFRNTAGWTAPYVYTWTVIDGSAVQYNGGWPGAPMEKVTGTDDLWYLTLDPDAVNIIFNNCGQPQTADLVIPTDGSNLYTWDTGAWSVYTAPCAHSSHDEAGNCSACGEYVGHGFEDGVCTACGTACTHSYENCLCVTCGMAEPMVQPTIGLKYPSVLFEDVILMNVYFDASDLEDVVEIGIITYEQKVSQWGVDTADTLSAGYQWSDKDSLYYVTTQGIAAKDMGSPMYFSIYARLRDGSYVYTNLITYSPSTYAYNVLNRSTSSQAMKALMVSMLNYGAAAQSYFGSEADPVNGNLTEEQQALVESYRGDMLDSFTAATAEKKGAFFEANTGFSNRTPSIGFEGAFSIHYYLTPSYEVSGDITLYIWDAAAYEAAEVLLPENACASQVMTLGEDGRYHGAAEGIAAKDLDKTVYVAAVYTGTDGETYTSGVLAYSIAAYCKSLAAGTSDIQPLAAATAVYGYYAKNCFA